MNFFLLADSKFFFNRQDLPTSLSMSLDLWTKGVSDKGLTTFVRPDRVQRTRVPVDFPRKDRSRFLL